MNTKRKVGRSISRCHKILQLLAIILISGLASFFFVEWLSKLARGGKVQYFDLNADRETLLRGRIDESKLIKKPGIKYLFGLNASSARENARQKILFENDSVSWRGLTALLETMIPGKPIVGTVANSAFMKLLFNWHHHTIKAKMKNVIVVSLDTNLHEECLRRGISSLPIMGLMNSSNFRGEGKIFVNYGAIKTGFVLAVLQRGWDVLMSDSDVAWVSNPEDVFSANAEMGSADALLSSDSLSISNSVLSMKFDPRPEANEREPQDWFRMATPRGSEWYGNVYECPLNTGIMFFRSTAASVQFCETWHQAMRTNGKSLGRKSLPGDQLPLNILMNINMYPIKVVEPPLVPKRHNRIFWAFNQTVKLGILSPAEFCNGHVYFVQRKLLISKVYAVHSTFQYHAMWGKVGRLRDAGLWLEDPIEYYTEGNFLSYDIELPEWIHGILEPVAKHRAALEHYFAATRKAMAIADISGRILILPKVMCFCELWWTPPLPPCRAPGSDVDPPFLCPIDYYINLKFWGQANVQFRDAHFLEHPELSPQIMNSKAVVPIGSGNEEATRTLPVNSSDSEVERVMESLASFRLVHLPKAFDSFCRFENETDNAGFDARYKNCFGLVWCCAPKGGPVSITVPPLKTVSFQSCNRPI